MTIQRHIQKKLISAISTNKIQLIMGPRYVGKHDLLNRVIQHLREEQKVPSERIFHFSLDDILVQLEFIEDFSHFVNDIENRIGQPITGLSEPVYFFFDQIQNYLSLAELIVSLYTTNPDKIKIIISSSVNLENDKTYQKTLAQHTNVLHLYPLSLYELIRNDIAPINGESVLSTIFKGKFDLEYFEYIQWIVEPYKDAVLNFFQEYLLYGGLPAIFRHDDAQTRWIELKNSLRQYLQRDIRTVYQISDLKKFDSILKILSTNNGDILNLLNLCDFYQINRNTIRKYSGILHDTFTLEYVPPFLKEKVQKPIMRTPKVYFLNTGLLNYLNKIDSFEKLIQAPEFSRLLESALFVNLKNTMHQLDSKFDIFFMKDYQEHEIDFLVSTPENLIPIGITWESEQKKVKIKTFKYYLRYCKRISDGVVFGKFDKIELLEMRGSRLFLLPLWMLW